MNKEIPEYIAENREANVYDLALKKTDLNPADKKFALDQIAGYQTAKKKFPKIAENERFTYPPKLNLEQTSSQATAQFKANLIKGKTLIDLTGGLGIDAIFFAELFEEVIHIEQNLDLQKIASDNFKALNLNKIQSYNSVAEEFYSSINKRVDWIYLDPARRSSEGNRVYSLEDLSPNPLEILPLYKEKAVNFLIKLSPMTDVEWLFNHLQNITEIHCVAYKNELKEILALGSFKSNKANQKVVAVNIDKEITEVTFNRHEGNSAPISPLKEYLYLPFKSILKSGYSDALCSYFNLFKIHSNSNLYTSEEKLDNFPGSVFDSIKEIKNPKKSLKNRSVRVIRRNYPIDTKAICKKYKCTTDGTLPIIFSTSTDGPFIVEAKQIQ